MEAYTKAIEIDHKNSEAYFKKANCLVDLGMQPEEVLKCYDKAIQINPDDAMAYYIKSIYLRSPDIWIQERRKL